MPHDTPDGRPGLSSRKEFPHAAPWHCRPAPGSLVLTRNTPGARKGPTLGARRVRKPLTGDEAGRSRTGNGLHTRHGQRRPALAGLSRKGRTVLNRTYMQKGIGATTFAIVAALIITLAAGLWATQTAQAGQAAPVIPWTSRPRPSRPGPTDGTSQGVRRGGRSRDRALSRGGIPRLPTSAKLEKASPPPTVDGRGNVASAARSAAGPPGDPGASATFTTGTCTVSTAAGDALSTFHHGLSLHDRGQRRGQPVRHLDAHRRDLQCPKTIKGQWAALQFAVFSNGTPGGFSVTASGVDGQSAAERQGRGHQERPVRSAPVAAPVLTAARRRRASSEDAGRSPTGEPGELPRRPKPTV